MLSVESLRTFLANNLETLRKAKGYSQEKLAELANISRGYYVNIARQKKNWPAPHVIEALAKALDTEPHLLLSPNLKDSPPEPSSEALTILIKENSRLQAQVESLKLQLSHLPTMGQVADFIEVDTDTDNLIRANESLRQENAELKRELKELRKSHQKYVNALDREAGE